MEHKEYPSVSRVSLGQGNDDNGPFFYLGLDHQRHFSFKEHEVNAFEDRAEGK